MLRGRFGDTSGRPYMEGHVLLPRLGLSGNVSFIFDTGADTSLLMPLDAQRMGIDYGLLGNELSTLGIGGNPRTSLSRRIWSLPAMRRCTVTQSLCTSASRRKS